MRQSGAFIPNGNRGNSMAEKNPLPKLSAANINLALTLTVVVWVLLSALVVVVREALWWTYGTNVSQFIRDYAAGNYDARQLAFAVPGNFLLGAIYTAAPVWFALPAIEWLLQNDHTDKRRLNRSMGMLTLGAWAVCTSELLGAIMQIGGANGGRFYNPLFMLLIAVAAQALWARRRTRAIQWRVLYAGAAVLETVVLFIVLPAVVRGGF